MEAPLFNDVHKLAIEMANFSAVEDRLRREQAYLVLTKLCFDNEGSNFDHPLQWEALGDFSDNNEEAAKAYEKGLACAKRLGLSEYEASIVFAMAELNLENGNNEVSKKLAYVAESIDHGDKALKDEIINFITEQGYT